MGCELCGEGGRVEAGKKLGKEEPGSDAKEDGRGAESVSRPVSNEGEPSLDTDQLTILKEPLPGYQH